MRRIIAALAAVALSLGFTLVLVGPAAADVSAPAANAVLRGQATLSAGGAGNGTACANGDGPQTTLQLLNSGGVVVFESVQGGTGAKSATITTQSYPNGPYTVRAIERNRTGFLFCSNNTKTTTRAVTIDNITSLSYGGDTSAAQNTTATVRATLTDPQLGASVLPNRVVTFTLSGGASVTGTTNSSGVATATLPVAGPPRSATVTASFAATTFYKPSSTSVPFAVGKNTSTTTLAAPAPVVHGEPTSFTATVSRVDGTSVPTGSVQFTVDGAAFGGPVPVGSGGVTTSGTTATLSTGSHAVGATYSGDANLLTSAAAPRTQIVNRAQTTTSLNGDPGSTVSGQSVTFTAVVDVVAPGVGTPSGGVQFNVDGQPFGTAVPLDGDTATLSIANLSTGNHQVDATYNGDVDFASSSAAALTHGVDKADASLALSTSNPGAVAGEPLTFSAALSAVGPGAGTPSGTVQFAVDGISLGAPVVLSGGTATSPTANLDAGPHLVTADYLGDADFGGAMDSLTQNVAAAATTTSVSSSPNPSVVGQTVTLRAEVSPVGPATGTPTGAVQFSVDGSPVGLFAQLDGGVAVLDISTLTRGTHTITAQYLSGSANFVTSTSPQITQTVNRAATATTVVSSSAPSVFGQPVTFTASVAVLAPGAGAPSGTVTFTDGASVLGTVPVDSSTGFQASVTTSTLSVAQHAIVATYSGDGSFLASNGSFIQKVNRAQTSTVVTSSANPAQSGQAVTFTASVSPVAPGAGSPTGTVGFTVNGAALGGPATLVGGVATSTTFASLSPGTYAIAATYNGDGSFVASTGGLDAGVGQNVAKGTTAMTLASSDASADFGQPVTFTSTVEAVAPATGRPSGVVQVWEGAVLLGATSLTADGPGRARATFVTSTLAPGAHAIRAVYVGNFNFTGQEAATSQTVGQVPTVTGVQSSADPITFGDPVTLTAVVTPSLSGPGLPSGTVTFSEGATVLGTATVGSVQGRRQASVTLPELSAGIHSVTATYAGDATYAASTSAPFTQQVDRAASRLEAEVMFTEQGGNAGAVRATLTGNDGAPLAGQSLVFTTTQRTDNGVIHICDVVTDAQGYASCDATALVAAINLNGGYDVDFAGNADYLPTRDHGSQFRAGE